MYSFISADFKESKPKVTKCLLQMIDFSIQSLIQDIVVYNTNSMLNKIETMISINISIIQKWKG